jgi:2-hydroxycyclohexanecarboxyl-CoA dehydrogenase
MTEPSQPLEGKVAIVTGAGQGIGRAIALVLAREGCAVSISGRTESKVVAVADEITRAGGRMVARRCDVGHRDDVDAMVAGTIDELGSLDIVVNNAQGGDTGTPRPTAEVAEDDVLEMFRSGPLGSLFVMQASFPSLCAEGGSVVNFGSAMGVGGTAKHAPYAMAKEAIRALTKVTAHEWGRYGIRVNTICPAAMSPSAQKYRDASPERFEAIVRAIPLRRFGDAELDIGCAVAALVSDDLRFLTGATLMLDGGQLMLT